MVAAALVGGTGASGSETAKAPGTGIQNGRYVDPSIGQALAASEGLPLDICRSRLPESEPLPPGQCALRPVCLPGASQPTELHVCSAPR